MSANAHRQQENSRRRDFSSRLREALDSSDLTAVELASKMGLAHSSVYRWMRNSVPKSSAIHAIAKELGVNANWLLTGEGPIEADASISVREDPVTEYAVQRQQQGGPSAAMAAMTDKELYEAALYWMETAGSATKARIRAGTLEAVINYLAELHRRDLAGPQSCQPLKPGPGGVK